jgi:hypothetical protein
LLYLQRLGVWLQGFDDEKLARSVQDSVRVWAPGNAVRGVHSLGEGGPEHAAARPDLHQPVLATFTNITPFRTPKPTTSELNPKVTTNFRYPKNTTDFRYPKIPQTLDI